MALLRHNALINNPIIRRSLTEALGSRPVQELNKQSMEAAAISGAIESVDSLPSLPDDAYPEGAVVFLTTDAKLYRNTDGSTWSRAVDGEDITVNTILGNRIVAGEISTSLLAASAVTTDKLDANSVTAAKINVTELSAISADMGSITAGNIVLSEFIRSGQTDYDTGTGFWLGDDGGTPKLSIGNNAGNKLTWDGSTLVLVGDLDGSSVTNLSSLSADLGAVTAGSITFNSTGAFIKLGTAGWESGIGFYVEYNSGTPRLFLGDASGNHIKWNGSTLQIDGDLVSSSKTGSFTGTLTGFVANPSETFHWSRTGDKVTLFVSSNVSASSNSASMVLTGLPAEIQPDSDQSVTCGRLVEDSVQNCLGRCFISSSTGDVSFFLFRPDTTNNVIGQRGFSNTGTKGILADWSITYGLD